MAPGELQGRRPEAKAVYSDRVRAEFRLPTEDLGKDLAFFTETLGFRLDAIHPADDPSVAAISGHGVRIRLERGAAEGPGTIRLLCHDPAAFARGRTELTAPNGTRIEIVDAAPPLVVPQTKHALMVHRRKDGDSWSVGRAGMLYRDLVPGRLGGALIASHIRIPEGGPVPDRVHYHRVRFQVIFCCRGWVKLVYEDQGPPFVLKAGDCVLQPPEIRHRVLEASDGLEVVELAAPADHVTAIHHDLALPTPARNPDREFAGQKFCRHEGAHAHWRPWRIAGFQARDTGIADSTAGVASVQVARPLNGGVDQVTSHTADILFTFILAGTMTLQAQGRDAVDLNTGDAFVIPPGMRTVYTTPSRDLELLEVSLPAAFETRVHGDV